MTEHNEQKDRSAEQTQQAAKNTAGKNSKSPESEGFDKKLDGPNRPSI
ncbi:hypothetical protein [Paenibacillus paridis]|nr:hypothetical protein [Paenibacillus paridis]